MKTLILHLGLFALLANAACDNKEPVATVYKKELAAQSEEQPAVSDQPVGGEQGNANSNPGTPPAGGAAALDGAALYSTTYKCAGCHGALPNSAKKGLTDVDGILAIAPADFPAHGSLAAWPNEAEAAAIAKVLE